MSAEDLSQQIQETLGDTFIPRIYSQRVLRQRTRAFRFNIASSRSKVSVQHTLLGVELKIGSQRLLCPDLATARYLSVFARLGCNAVAVPYDITKISSLADALESSWYRMLLLIDEATATRTDQFKARLRGLLFATIRSDIAVAGPGSERPEFKTSTKQRTS